jgi:hypothetical protein
MSKKPAVVVLDLPFDSGTILQKSIPKSHLHFIPWKKWILRGCE